MTAIKAINHFNNQASHVIGALFCVAVGIGVPSLAHAQERVGTGQPIDLCANLKSSPSTAAPVTIRYGLTGGGEEPLALLWADKSQFPNNGKVYSLEPKLFGANDRMTAVQAGQLDAGSISLTALVTAIRFGVDLKAVASLVETNEHDNQGAFVVLKDSGITSASQFGGKKIGFYGPNTISEYWIKSAIRRSGVSTSGPQYVALPPPAQEQALRNKQIDVAWLSRQFLAKAEKKGGINVLLRPIQATGLPHPSTVVFFTQKFVKEHPAAYCAWRADYQKALSLWAEKRDQLYPSLIAAKYVTPNAADAGADGGRAKEGRIDIKEVQATIDDMVSSGFLPPSRVVKAEETVLRGYALQK
ncbi:Bicarbonate-binding protein CmpA [Pandoraea pneumonica]|uniref:Bicarbonate-binding protein CmpA n=2 Tax=Pandoraea pneumonica TaxID=2508299 RepID=A0A5E4VR28_9BURK|nr:Bicarbonate-binding protein CmpA [Pandoraea pneumonica]